MPYQLVEFLQTSLGYIVVLSCCLGIMLITNPWIGALSLVAAYILLMHNVRNNNIYKFGTAEANRQYLDDGRAPSSGPANFFGIETEMVSKMTKDVFNGSYIRPTWHAQYDSGSFAASAGTSATH